MVSGLPWKGEASLQVNPRRKQAFALHVRLPGWLKEPVPGNLYRYANDKHLKATLSVNGSPVDYQVKNGYAVIQRTWKKGDVVSISLPMEVRRVVTIDSVAQNRNRVALQYGPMMYCVEGADNKDNVFGLIVPATTKFETEYRSDLLGGINTIKFTAPVVTTGSDGLSVTTQQKEIRAIPYFSWNNRGADDMQIWLPSTVKKLEIVTQ